MYGNSEGQTRQEGPAMDIEFQWKTAESNIDNCPARYRAPGGYVIQGRQLDAATRAQLRDVAGGVGFPGIADEDAVWVPSDVIDGPDPRI